MSQSFRPWTDNTTFPPPPKLSINMHSAILCRYSEGICSFGGLLSVSQQAVCTRTTNCFSGWRLGHKTQTSLLYPWQRVQVQWFHLDLIYCFYSCRPEGVQVRGSESQQLVSSLLAPTHPPTQSWGDGQWGATVCLLHWSHWVRCSATAPSGGQRALLTSSTTLWLSRLKAIGLFPSVLIDFAAILTRCPS